MKGGVAKEKVPTYYTMIYAAVRHHLGTTYGFFKTPGHFKKKCQNGSLTASFEEGPN